MVDKKIPEPVLKGVVEHAARLRAEIEQTDKAIAKAKDDLMAREALLVSMKQELEQVDAFLKVHVPEDVEADPRAISNWLVFPSKRAERQHKYFPFEGKAPQGTARNDQLTNWFFSPSMRPSPTARKAIVIEMAMKMMAAGKPVTTAEIVEKLSELGVDLEVSNPITRVSQILSEDDRFVTARGVGWWLKGEDPGGTGSSNATD